MNAQLLTRRLRTPRPAPLRTAAHLLLLAALGGSGSAAAAVITQSENFNFSAGPASSGSGSLEVFDSTALTATMSPFDASLGTLDSFSINWDMDFGASGTTLEGGGFFNASVGGSFSLAGTGYGGAGNSAGDGSATIEGLILNFAIDQTNSFVPANANVSYSPALLTAVTGSTDFDLAFGTGYSINYTTMEDVAGLAIGTVTLTYTYTAVPAPGPLALLLFGLLAAGRGRTRPARAA